MTDEIARPARHGRRAPTRPSVCGCRAFLPGRPMARPRPGFSCTLLRFARLVAVIPAHQVLLAGCLRPTRNVAGPTRPRGSHRGRRWRRSPQTAPRLPVSARLAGRPHRLDLADIVDIALRTSTDTRAAWARPARPPPPTGAGAATGFPSVNVSASIGRSRASSTGERIRRPRQRTYGVSAEGAGFSSTSEGGAPRSRRHGRPCSPPTGPTTPPSRTPCCRWSRPTTTTSPRRRCSPPRSHRARTRGPSSTPPSSDTRRGWPPSPMSCRRGRRSRRSSSRWPTLQGAVATTRGALATAMGLPANTAFDVDLPRRTRRPTEITADVERYLERAKARRPDLAAARAQARRSDAHVRKVLADGLPVDHGDREPRPRLSRQPRPVQRPLCRHDPAALADLQRVLQRVRHRPVAGPTRRRPGRGWRAWNRRCPAGLDQLLRPQDRRAAAADDRRPARERQASPTRSRRGATTPGSAPSWISSPPRATLERRGPSSVQAMSDWYISLAQLARDTGVLDAAGARAHRRKETGHEPRFPDRRPRPPASRLRAPAPVAAFCPARGSVSLALLALACSREPAGGGRPAGRPPVPVTVATARSRDVPVTLPAIGAVEASNTVKVRPGSGES